VNDALENAYLIRRAAAQDPAMSKYIRVCACISPLPAARLKTMTTRRLQFLDVKDLVPAEYRQSSAKDQFYDGRQYNRLEDWWYAIPLLHSITVRRQCAIGPARVFPPLPSMA
jgi:hypothetical protein